MSTKHEPTDEVKDLMESVRDKLPDEKTRLSRIERGVDYQAIYDVPITHEIKDNIIIITFEDSKSAEVAEKRIDKAIHEMKRVVHVYGGE